MPATSRRHHIIAHALGKGQGKRKRIRAHDDGGDEPSGSLRCFIGTMRHVPWLGIALLVTVGPAAIGEDLARQAAGILERTCHSCHGRGGSVEGGMNYVMDAVALVARKKIIAGDSARSKLVKRLINEGDPMPPAGHEPRPTADEIQIIRKWIDAGAPALAEAGPARRRISLEQELALVMEDLRGLDERKRRYVRYLSITPLHNAGLSEDEIQTHRVGVSKLLNSLSWQRRIAVPVPVDADQTILRIDLRDYGWNARLWQRLIEQYPYRLETSAAEFRGISEMLECEVPVVRADWFVHAASRPPLYHDLLQLPETDTDLERMLRVDVMENIRSDRVVRAGFNGSGVSRHNRLIERHESPYGAYWKSYDFDVPDGEPRKNLLAHPLGPDPIHGPLPPFEHDGGEIIFNLPNGLQAYLLVDAKGGRIDKGPQSIVSDPRQGDRAVVNGVSCMSCHATGIIDKEDQVRRTAIANTRGFGRSAIEAIKAVYPPREVFADLVKEDQARFRRVVELTGAPLSKTEPIAALALRFEQELDLKLAAAEAGVEPGQLKRAIQRSRLLSETLGALTVEGGTVQRTVFQESFLQLAHELRSALP